MFVETTLAHWTRIIACKWLRILLGVGVSECGGKSVNMIPECTEFIYSYKKYKIRLYLAEAVHTITLIRDIVIPTLFTS